MDQIDAQLLSILQRDGRMTISDLSKKLALSRPSVSERLQRLQERGVIQRFSATVSPKALGRDTQLFIQVSELKRKPEEFEDFIEQNEDVLECHRVTGPVSYFIKAAVSGMDGLRMLVDELIPYGNVNTSIILKSPVENRMITPIKKTAP
ncbi:Lrp/AsnC family transcriptional regulator [Priestia megaterium]|uniref:Lrp/AsnC family transcriptional regulator n=1 Tax=Priestia megaterium TaxID=1404 RepID=UPI00203D2F82|nr:Lrp/AsnC family transcriptional regulator [Priestia megaterium]MCM3791799.1 Lrp/AsnC family transcriptional regulator [Priestia megaterium]